MQVKPLQNVPCNEDIHLDLISFTVICRLFYVHILQFLFLLAQIKAQKQIKLYDFRAEMSIKPETKLFVDKFAYIFLCIYRTSFHHYQCLYLRHIVFFIILIYVH